MRKEEKRNVGQVEEMKNFRSKIERYYLPITVFITGAVILVLEILGTRIIAPYYGTTIYVWSSLIGVTLVALASGYFLGGWIADKMPRIDIVYLIIFIAAISIIVIPIITNFVLVKTNVLGARYGALTSACILFTIPLILLGTIVPYVIKLKTKELGKIGITAGSLYSIATIGSFFGAIITGFYLIPNIGINSIVYLSSGLLLLLSLFWFIVHGKKTLSVSTISFIAVIILVIFTGLSITKPMPNEDIEIIYEEESPYSRLKVIAEDESRYLIMNGAMQTVYSLEYKRFKFTYLKLFENAVKYHSNPKDVLVIGLGGGGVDKRLKNYREF